MKATLMRMKERSDSTAPIDKPMPKSGPPSRWDKKEEPKEDKTKKEEKV